MTQANTFKYFMRSSEAQLGPSNGTLLWQCVFFQLPTPFAGHGLSRSILKALSVILPQSSFPRGFSGRGFYMVQTHDMKSREIPHILALYQWEYSWCPYSDAALSFFLLFLFLFFLSTPSSFPWLFFSSHSFSAQQPQPLTYRFLRGSVSQILGNNINSTTFINLEERRKPPMSHPWGWGRHTISKLCGLISGPSDWISETSSMKVSSFLWTVAPIEYQCLNILLQEKEGFIIFYGKLLFSLLWSKQFSWWNYNILKNSKGLLQLSVKPRSYHKNM